MLGMIERHVQFEGDRSTIYRYDATVSETKFVPVSATLTIGEMRLAEFNDQRLGEHLINLADQLAAVASKRAYEQLDTAITEVGNVVDAAGKPFDEELVLQMIEKMEHSFDKSGNWIFPKVSRKPRNREPHGSKFWPNGLRQIRHKAETDIG